MRLATSGAPVAVDPVNKVKILPVLLKNKLLVLLHILKVQVKRLTWKSLILTDVLAFLFRSSRTILGCLRIGLNSYLPTDHSQIVVKFDDSNPES
jgi:hypothetical protein